MVVSKFTRSDECFWRMCKVTERSGICVDLLKYSAVIEINIKFKKVMKYERAKIHLE